MKLNKGWREREVINNTEQHNLMASGDQSSDGEQDRAIGHRVIGVGDQGGLLERGSG